MLKCLLQLLVFDLHFYFIIIFAMAGLRSEFVEAEIAAFESSTFVFVLFLTKIIYLISERVSSGCVRFVVCYVDIWGWWLPCC